MFTKIIYKFLFVFMLVITGLEIQAGDVYGKVVDIHYKPIVGATVTLYDGTEVLGTGKTGADGICKFLNISEDRTDLVLTASKENYFFKPDEHNIYSAGGDNSIVTGTFCAKLYSVSFSGKVTDSEGNPMAGIDVLIKDTDLIDEPETVPVVVTDSEGNYTYDGFISQYLVKVSDIDGYISDPVNKMVVFTEDYQNITDVNFTLVKSDPVVSGKVLDLSSNPLKNVKITVLDSAEKVIAEELTDTNGNYTVQGLENKQPYTLIPSLDGYAFTHSNKKVRVYGDVNNVDFNAKVSDAHIISGKILSTTGEALSGVNVKLTQGTDTVAEATADEQGVYQITGVLDGDYTITPTTSAYVFEPNSLDISVNGSDILNQDFTGTYMGINEPIEIPNCVLWLDGADPRGDANPTDGELITWVDKSGKGNNACQYNDGFWENYKAFVHTGVLNGKSVVNFPNGHELFIFSTVWARTIFWVLKEAEDSLDERYARAFIGYTYNNGFYRGQSPTVDFQSRPDGKIWEEHNIIDALKNGNTYLNRQLVDGTQTVLPVGKFNSLTLVTGADTPTSVGSPCNELTMGSNSWNYGWKGDIAEIIIYDRALYDSERKAVEEYLQKKWFSPTANDDKYIVEMNNTLSIDTSKSVLLNDEIKTEHSNLTAELVDGPSNGTLDFNSDGSFTYTPNTDFAGTDSFTYIAIDEGIPSSPAIVKINVKQPDENIPPVANDDYYEMYGGGPFVVNAADGVLANDTDDDNVLLDSTIVEEPENGTLQLNSNGSFSYTPSSDWSGLVTFSYMANDGIDDSVAPATVSIRVHASLNNPMVISGCRLWLDGSDPNGDGSIVSGSLKKWINKADTSNVAFQRNKDDQATVLTDALNGHSVLNFPDGEQYYSIVNSNNKYENIKIPANTVFWVIKENPDLLGSKPIPFFLGYSKGKPFTRGVELNEYGNYIYSGTYWDEKFAADEVKNGQTYLDGNLVDGVNDIFPSGDFHIVSLVLTGPVNIDSITHSEMYTANDMSWQGDIAEIIIYDHPLTDTSRKAIEQYLKTKWLGATTYTISGTVKDANSNPVEGVKVKIDDTNFAITDIDGKYSITGLPNEQYTVIPESDDYTFEPDSVVLTISNADVSADFTAIASAPLKYFISGTVLDEQGVGVENVTVSVDDSHTVETDADGKYVINNLLKGSYTVTPVLDGYTFASEIQMPVEITDANLTDINFTASPVQTEAYSISGTILDEQGVGVDNVTVSVDNTHTAATDADGKYVINNLLKGSYTVTPVLDGYTFASEIQMPVEITDANLTDINFTASPVQTQAYSISGTVFDENGEPLEGVEISDGNGKDVTSDIDGKYVLTDLTKGSYNLVASYDGYSFVSSEIMPIEVVDTDVVVNFVGKQENNLYTISGRITDADGKGLNNVILNINTEHSVIKTNINGNYIIKDLTNGTYELIPVLEGYTFTPAKLTAVIDNYDINNQDFTAIENSAPVAVDDSFFSVIENTTLTVSAPGILSNDSDSDGDVITAKIASNPTKGTVVVNRDGAFTYTPNVGKSGVDTFTYVAVDEKGAISNEAEVTITINPAGVNNTPVALDDKYSTQVDTELTVDAPGILGNDFDVDGDTLNVIISSITQPVNGTLVVQKNGSFIYTPKSGFEGEDSFSYTANDGNNNSNIATVKISVIAPNGQPPVANNEIYKIETGSKLVIAAPGVLENDLDPDGDTITAKLVDDVKNGTLTLKSDGSFSYTPNNEFVGKDSFTYIASDGQLDSDLATVKINVIYQKVTLGTPVTVSPQQAHLAAGATFDKGKAKIYGVLNGKNLNLKNDKSSAPGLLKAFWAKKYPLYDKKLVKSGYAAAIDNQNQAKNISLTVKGKSNGTKFENQAQTITLVPPEITSVRISGTTITIKGKYFGVKAPKVALEPIAGGKLVKCKVDKKSYSFDITEKADSTVTATYKAKKAPAGSYRLILDNKIGIGVEINDEGKEVLPTVKIGGN